MRKRRRNGLGIDIMDRRIGSKSRSGARESSKSNVHIDTMPTIYAQDQARSENEPVARGPRRAGIPGRHLPTITLPPHLIRSFAQVEALGRQLPHATHTAFGGRGGDIRHPEEGEGGRYRACAYYNVRNTVKRSPSSSASGEKGRERRGIPARIPPRTNTAGATRKASGRKSVRRVFSGYADSMRARMEDPTSVRPENGPVGGDAGGSFEDLFRGGVRAPAGRSAGTR